MKIINKILAVLSIGILDIMLLINTVNATNINTANLNSAGMCPILLKYKGVPVEVTYVQYNNGGTNYPAYCLDKNLPGVTEENPYTVNIENAITDVGLWRRIINGYPYKTVSELGCANEQEAFTATKQAIYCYIHENKIEDYEAIGEAGARTLQAMQNIITNAENSKETKISNTITIKKESDNWKQDEEQKEYLAKTYNVAADGKIKNYKVYIEKIEKELPEGIKIVDKNNQNKKEFEPGESFKIMIPISKIKQTGNFKINVETTIKTKPVLYGKAPNSNLQDYAITVATYEDGYGKTIDEYPKNETKIIIEKQDEETKEKLKDVEFEILNEKKEVVYTNLKTDEEGKIEIENIIPGIYYIKEVKTLEDYEINKELTQIEIEFNQTATILINNKKGEKPKTTIQKVSKNIEIKTLPKTGE